MPSPTREPEAIPARRLLGYESPSEAPEATGVELLVLKRGPLFAVTNRLGDIAPAGARDQGLFFRDTRYLSHYALAVAGGPPVVLSSQTSREYVTQIDMTCTRQGYGGVFQGDPVNFLHLRREQLVDDRFSEQLTLTNFVTHPLDFWLELRFAADFADVFEVRGHRRARRGTYFAPELLQDGVVLSYRGLDGRRYLSELRFSPAPVALRGGLARFEMHLAPNEACGIAVDVCCGVERVPGPTGTSLRERVKQTEAAQARWDSIRGLTSLLFAEPSPAPAKYWLARIGLIDSAEVRSPMVEVGAKLAARLNAEMEIERGAEPRLRRA